MLGHHPSRRNFFKGLSSALCAWPFVRRAAASTAGPAAGTPIVSDGKPARSVTTFVYDASERLVSVINHVYDATATWDIGLARVTTFTYEYGRRDPR